MDSREGVLIWQVFENAWRKRKRCFNGRADKYALDGDGSIEVYRRFGRSLQKFSSSQWIWPGLKVGAIGIQ
jgi:hypothetical protein